MFKLFTKLSKTYKLIKSNLPELKKELKDLTGATRTVIKGIVDIWN